jgi:hypothetical protein
LKLRQQGLPFGGAAMLPTARRLVIHGKVPLGIERGEHSPHCADGRKNAAELPVTFGLE